MASLHSQLDSHHIHGGFLYKKGVYNTKWKKRYFVLFDDRTISYFEKEKHCKSRNKAKGSIHLTQVHRVELVHFIDPHLTRKSSMANFNQIVTNDTFNIDPKNKSKIKQNSQKQNNFIHRQSSLPQINVVEDNILNEEFVFDRNKISKLKTTQSSENIFISSSMHTTPTKEPFVQSTDFSKWSALNEDKESLKPPKIAIFKSKSAEDKNLNKVATNWNEPKTVRSKRKRLNTFGSPRDWDYNFDNVLSPRSKYTNVSGKIVRLQQKVQQRPSSAKAMLNMNGWSVEKSVEKEAENELIHCMSTPINSQQYPSDYEAKKEKLSISQSQTPTTDSDQSDLEIKQQNDEKRPSLHVYSASFNKDNEKQKNVFSYDQVSRPQSAKEQTAKMRHLIRQLSDDKNDKKRASHLPRPPIRRSISKSHKSKTTETFIVPSTPNQISAHYEMYSDEDESSSMSLEMDKRIKSKKEQIQRSITANTWNMTQEKKKKKHKKNRNDIIVSDHIRKFNRDRRRSEDDLSHSLMSHSANDHSLYSRILEDTQSDLSADRRYSFALIQPDRNWILSAETESDCKKWMALFDKLVQGKIAYKGYLIKRGKNIKSWKKRYFVLFENKVLNYYNSQNIKEPKTLLGDIDLRHAMWLRLCNQNEFKLNASDYFDNEESASSKKKRKSLTLSGKKAKKKRRTGSMISLFQTKNKSKTECKQSYLFEIATPNRTWIFCAENESQRNAWYAQIRDVFGDKLYFKIYFDSPCHVCIVQTGQYLKERYVALMKGWLIVFRQKEKLNDVRKMTFFSDTIFRNYIRGYSNCICIPLINADIRQNFDSNYGRFSFEVKIDSRCWYFDVNSQEILSKWLKLLTKKNVDYSRYEESYSNLPTPMHNHRNEYKGYDEKSEDVKEDVGDNNVKAISPYFKPTVVPKQWIEEIKDYDMKEIDDEGASDDSENESKQDMENMNVNLSVNVSGKDNKLSWNTEEDQDSFQHGLDMTLEEVITPIQDSDGDEEEIVFDIN